MKCRTQETNASFSPRENIGLVFVFVFEMKVGREAYEKGKRTSRKEGDKRG